MAESEFPIRILLIEDSPLDARVIENAFKNQGASIDRATTLEFGEKLLRAQRYDLVLLDLLLPDSCGLDKICVLQAIAPETPIVVVSGVEDEFLARRARQMGADDFICKSQYNVPLINRAARQALDRARARRDLMQSERWLKAICAASRDGIFVENQGRIVFANQSCAELLGFFSPAELTARAFEELLVREEAGSQMAPAGQSESALYELTCQRQDGSVIPLEASVSSFELQGKVYQITVLRDTRARKQLEETARRARQLESIGRLAGGVAHDFNNLLMIIRGYADLLLEDPALAKAQRAPLDEIRTATTRASNLTRQLLTVGRRQIRRPQDLDIREQVHWACKSAKETSRLELRFEDGASTALMNVRMDAEQLQQVVNTLISNAQKACAKGGAISVGLERVELDAEQARRMDLGAAGAYALLSVVDTGAAIPAESLPHVFEPFFLARPSGTAGLELATLFAIVRQANGHAAAESSEQAGAAFRVWLPLFGEPAQQAPATKTQGKAKPDTGSRTILVVEDEPSLRRLTSHMLSQLGFTIISAPDGQSALALANEYPGTIDLLLTDVIMPRMNGRAVADGVAKIRPGIRVLFMSGYSDQILAQRGCLISGIELLEKPFTKAMLLERLEHVLGQNDAPGQKTLHEGEICQLES